MLHCAADSSGNRLPEDTRLDRQLVEAARDGELSEVARALDMGASPEAGQATGYTALGLAVNRGHTEVVELLLRRRASPNTPICANNATPLMIAVVWDRRDSIALLLASGCDLSARGSSGSYRDSTALDVARQRGRAAAAAQITHERATRHLRRLRRMARHAGRFACALLELYTDLRFRPGGEGARQASAHFLEAMGAAPPTLSARETARSLLGEPEELAAQGHSPRRACDRAHVLQCE